MSDDINFVPTELIVREESVAVGQEEMAAKDKSLEEILQNNIIDVYTS